MGLASSEVTNWPGPGMEFSYTFILFQMICRKLDCRLYHFLKCYKSCMEKKKKRVGKFTQSSLAYHWKNCSDMKTCDRKGQRRSYSHCYYPRVMVHLRHLKVSDLIMRALPRFPEHGIQPLGKQVKFFVIPTLNKSACLPS